VGLFLGDVLLVEPEGHVVFDREGVEEGGLLEDHANAPAKFEQVGLAHVRDVFAEDVDGAGVRPNKAIDELHQNGFPTASRAENDAGFARLDGEVDVFEDGFDIELDGDVFEHDYRIR